MDLFLLEQVRGQGQRFAGSYREFMDSLANRTLAQISRKRVAHCQQLIELNACKQSNDFRLQAILHIFGFKMHIKTPYKQSVQTIPRVVHFEKYSKLKAIRQILSLKLSSPTFGPFFTSRTTANCPSHILSPGFLTQQQEISLKCN